MQWPTQPSKWWSPWLSLCSFGSSKVRGIEMIRHFKIKWSLFGSEGSLESNIPSIKRRIETRPERGEPPNGVSKSVFRGLSVRCQQSPPSVLLPHIHPRTTISSMLSSFTEAGSGSYVQQLRLQERGLKLFLTIMDEGGWKVWRIEMQS